MSDKKFPFLFIFWPFHPFILTPHPLLLAAINLFSVFLTLGFVLFCFALLDSTCKRDYTVFVFLWMTYTLEVHPKFGHYSLQEDKGIQIFKEVKFMIISNNKNCIKNIEKMWLNMEKLINDKRPRSWQRGLINCYYKYTQGFKRKHEHNEKICNIVKIH